MYEPGWYHAQGDPPDTVRYWDGQTWQGEPTRQSDSGGVIYYAATSDAQVDLGDIATRTTLAEQATENAAETRAQTSYAVSPYSVSRSSVNVKRRKRFPEGLKNLAILVSVLKGLPLAWMALGVVRLLRDAALADSSFARYNVPGVDLDAGVAAVATIFTLIAVVGAAILYSQVRAAINDQAGTLFAISILMTCLDLVTGGAQWLGVGDGEQIASALFVSVAFVLQLIVTIWSGFLANKR